MRMVPLFPIVTVSDWLPVLSQPPDPAEYILASDGFSSQYCRLHQDESGTVVCTDPWGNEIEQFCPLVWSQMPIPTII